jgi:mRNA-degrading endonuclease RelE of RelBE toxin-antitoxin system
MTFKLLFSSNAEKQIRRLSASIKAKIEDACIEIRKNPFLFLVF